MGCSKFYLSFIMGCICSKGAAADDHEDVNPDIQSGKNAKVASSKRGEVVTEADGSIRPKNRSPNAYPTPVLIDELGKNQVDKAHHLRIASMPHGTKGEEPPLSRIVSMPHGTNGEQVVAGWPPWLSSVAGEAIQGWVPRRADSFEKLDKIGQGTYSTVYKARDLETGKVVALKKVRFVNMDPESVRFMAREIYIMRKLDHPNVLKLEGLVTSRMSGSLYLVFEYMEHDLAGLAALSGVRFTESQIKCYMQQLLCGLEHCHSRGVLHRDIKGSNLLVDDKGILRIADFGLATRFQPDQKHPLTSRVVTLWYRPPELLLGATEYGVAVDLWSTGCILAELLAGKPIMPGRTEVEQLHKIFKLCGSPSEDYWKKSKLPNATVFKPQHSYKRRISETFKEFPSSSVALLDVLLAIEPEKRGSAASALKSEFFTTAPLPCKPSSLPKYAPSKELDAKRLNEEAKRQKAAAAKEHGSVPGKRTSKDSKEMSRHNSKMQKQKDSNSKSANEKYNLQEDSGSGFPIEPSRGSHQLTQRSAHGSSWTKKTKEDESLVWSRQAFGSVRQDNLGSMSTHPRWPEPQSNTGKRESTPHFLDGLSSSQKQSERIPVKDSTTGYHPKKNRIHYSGPLMPPGGNLEYMLIEHERKIQDAVRKARLDKVKS